MRVYLTGTLQVETAAGWLPLQQLPGRQGRRAFAYLVRRRGQPVTHGELAEAVWSDAPPPAWERALSALLSKLRAVLNAAEPGAGVASAAGWYLLELPPDIWIDIEAAQTALDEAEGALRRLALPDAWGNANVAAVIARRPFLPGEEGAWIDAERAALHQLLVRALDCLADVALHTGEATLAVRYATDSTALEPFRERGYQRLMRAHAAAGNRAEALRVYQQCRALLREELGVDPTSDTEALYLTLL